MRETIKFYMTRETLREVLIVIMALVIVAIIAFYLVDGLEEENKIRRREYYETYYKEDNKCYD